MFMMDVTGSLILKTWNHIFASFNSTIMLVNIFFSILVVFFTIMLIKYTSQQYGLIKTESSFAI